MPLQATSGAASYDAFGGGVAVVPNYIEDVFSTYLYTGDDATQTITNGIDLAGKGGLVWIKTRNQSSLHVAFDTNRGVNNYIFPNQTDAQNSYGVINNLLTSFNSNGFSLGADGLGGINGTGDTQVSWTFRKQPKFFDVVTFTSNSTGGATINHLLDSAPGCVIVKSTAATGNWFVYHRSLDPAEYLFLNTSAVAANGGRTVTTSSTQVTYPSGYFANSATYVAYIFAHNAGGFGLSGTDNVISCGSYTGNGSFTGTVVNLGFEPQWLMVKRTNDLADWLMFDNMRGVATASAAGNGPDARLSANDSAAENSGTDFVSFTSTGFQLANDTSSINGNGSTYIYIAIRRGPMKVPTDGTKVFAPVARTGTGANVVVDTTITGDAFLIDRRNSAGNAFGLFASRLTGAGKSLWTTQTYAEISDTTEFNSIGMNTITLGTSSTVNSSAGTYIDWFFKRAPGFFDEVCYTGNSVDGRTIPHNLAAVPELMIVRNRTQSASNWFVYSSPTGNTQVLQLNQTQVPLPIAAWANTTPTSTIFTVNDGSSVNNINFTYVAYLFASCPGVSKVGSYTGTGTTRTINCGFTAGSRFVLIKRTDSTGDWYVWDSARGIVAGNDPYLLLNSTAAEVTNTDFIDTAATGFEISSTAPAAINANGGTFIFLAIA